MGITSACPRPVITYTRTTTVIRTCFLGVTKVSYLEVRRSTLRTINPLVTNVTKTYTRSSITISILFRCTKETPIHKRPDHTRTCLDGKDILVDQLFGWILEGTFIDTLSQEIGRFTIDTNEPLIIGLEV
jgi:hypothetical protein